MKRALRIVAIVLAAVALLLPELLLVAAHSPEALGAMRDIDLIDARNSASQTALIIAFLLFVASFVLPRHDRL